MTPRGWYDIGGGWAGMWDGEKWTGERISHEQLAAMTRPPTPPPPTGAHQRKPLTARQRNTSIAVVAGLVGLFVLYAGLRGAGVIEPPATTRRVDPFTDAAEIYQTAQPRQVESCCAALVVVLGRPGEPILDGQVTAFSRLLGRLGMPAGTAARMDGTRALDGTQSAEGEHATATWTYHPDDGLRVVFQPK